MLFRSKVVGLLTFTIDRLVTVCEQPTAEVAYAAYAVGLLDPRCVWRLGQLKGLQQTIRR